MLRRVLQVALALCAPAAPAAHAAEPIMPLAEVRAGMRCTGLSVVRGTEIASFDVEVIDVIADDPAAGGARILVRTSGPAVDATGIGPGFSGSPILCDGRNAGAISEGIGEYGNHVVLATPIEEILSARPVRAPAGARRAVRLRRAARPLAAPLTVSGLSEATRRIVARAARRADRVVLAAPPGPLGGYPPQEMRPGAAVSAARSTGDVSVGAVGTVAYRDGDQVFAFGHPLDALGRRSLFLQDAYVFGVIGNPVGIPDLGAITYKLASSGGHPLGTVTNDLFPAIAGIVGQEPPSIPLRVAARERGGPGSVVLHSRLADERELGLGAGLSLVAPLAASTAIDRLLRSFEPATIVACTRFRVRELRRPIGYCNPYFDGFSMLGDVTDASILVDTFDLAPLHVTAAGVSIAASRGVIDEVIVGARARGTAQPGSRVPVRVELRRHGGGRRSLTVRVPVPRDLRPGLRTLVLEGNGFPDDEELFIEVIEEGLRRVARPGSSPALDRRRRARAAQAEPRTVRQLARAVARLRRPLGITARFRRREPRVVHASGRVRFDGRAKVRLRVRRAPR